MKASSKHFWGQRWGLGTWLASTLIVTSACSAGNGDPDTGERGGAPSAGGKAAQSGGTSPGQGGAPAQGGASSQGGASQPAQGGSAPAQGGNAAAQGGALGSGGATSQGGATGQGGSTSSQGGNTGAQGGRTAGGGAAQGGNTSKGGAASGGTNANGGVASGGTNANGGTQAMGGRVGNGGTQAAGGSVGSGGINGKGGAANGGAANGGAASGGAANGGSSGNSCTTVGGGTCPASLTCPSGMNCGCTKVTNLGANKKKILDAGGDVRFMASAMMETADLTTNYPHGDNKTGDSFNAGLCKQNWYMTRQCHPAWNSLKPADYETSSAMNTDIKLDITVYNECRAKYPDNQWFAGHRNGQSGIMNPNTSDIAGFRAATEWTQTQLNGHTCDDVRFWVDVKPIIIE